MGKDKYEEQKRTNGKTKGDYEAYRERRRAQSEAEPADWSTVDGELLRSVISAIAAKGGAVRFGYSRDGMAYAVGFYLGPERWTEYVRPSEDVSYYLQGVALDFTGG